MATSVKVPGVPLVPMRKLGPTPLHDLLEPVPPAGREPVASQLVRAERELLLVGVERLAAQIRESLGVEHHDRAPNLVLRRAIPEHLRSNQACDPDAGRPGAEEYEPLSGERLVQDPQGRSDPGEHDGRRALDVVVEARDPVAVTVEEADRVVLLEVLPLEHRVGEDLDDALDEGFDEAVVRRTAQSRLPVADVVGIVQQRPVVGPDVERDRQAQRRVDPGAGGVERQLADGDPHATAALVAEAQDPLVVRHHDQPDVVLTGVGEELGDPIDVIGREPEAARPTHDVAVLLTGTAHDRRVHDGHELLEVLQQDPVEERLVAVLERREPDEPLEFVALAAVLRDLEGDLLFERSHARRQEPAEPEDLSLLLGERGVLVQQRLRQQLVSAVGDRHRCQALFGSTALR